MTNGLVIWGASGHALVVADIVRSQGEYEIIGFLDDVDVRRRNTAFCGAKVLGGKEQLTVLPDLGVKHLIVAMGDCEARMKTGELIRESGFELATAIHPRAVVAQNAVVGAGTIVAAGAVINPASIIGENVIVNTSASIDHECVIEDGAHIGPGARLGGRVKVGRATWIGIGAIVKDRVMIGANSILGAGAVLLDDLPNNVIAYGVPARIQRKIEAIGE